VGHPAVEERLELGGAEPVAHLLQPIRVVAGGEPACQLAEPDAALAGLLLGHSWPLTHTLAGQGK